VEILDGVEGLVHISELAAHHVENPREIVQPGDELRVKILEIDSERRRLSLSAKRVEGQVLPTRRIESDDAAADAEPSAEGEVASAPEGVGDIETAESPGEAAEQAPAADDGAQAPAEAVEETAAEETAAEPQASADGAQAPAEAVDATAGETPAEAVDETAGEAPAEAVEETAGEAEPQASGDEQPSASE
ncbi:MAG TPA: S1 RNA-binding domain-containing protein, partial [Solirubrobacteraceae bacterium]|nr:S1 RNA-binding domain-containing protein [Solirubrobacteraceae bacterium]